MNTTATAVAKAASPGKSRRRWYIVGLLLPLFASPVAFYFYAGWRAEREMQEMEAEFDADDPGWRWADILPGMEPISDEENSVRQIMKVHTVSRGRMFNPGPKWDSAELIPNTRLTAEQAEAVEAAFSRCDSSLRGEARKLKEMPRGRFKIPADGNLFEFDFEEMQKSRQAVYVLQADAALRAHEGDLDGAAQSCQAMLNTAAAFDGNPCLIGCLVRMAEQTIAVQAIERTLGLGMVSEAELKKLQEMLQREAETDGVLTALRGERAANHEMYFNVKSGATTISKLIRGGQKGSLVESGAAARMLDAFPGVILKYYPDYLRTLSASVRASKLQPHERTAELAKIDRSVRENGNVLSRLMSPATVKVSEASMRSQAYLRCSITAIAAERYRLRHDAWPKTLDELIKEGLLAKVPTDPYDGKPLRYLRMPSGVVIYSVGMDRTDNGGKLFRNGGSFDGTDFGFELWDPKMRSLPPVSK